MYNKETKISTDEGTKITGVTVRIGIPFGYSKIRNVEENLNSTDNGRGFHFKITCCVAHDNPAAKHFSWNYKFQTRVLVWKNCIDDWFRHASKVVAWPCLQTHARALYVMNY